LVMAADVLVAEVTTPSHGVGYEIGRALENHKRILCIYRPTPSKKLSAMLAGNPALIVAEYQTMAEAVKIIDDFFKDKK
jgi:2'-deoxynucleoside 5'-phosphate N-hydrolase